MLFCTLVLNWYFFTFVFLFEVWTEGSLLPRYEITSRQTFPIFSYTTHYLFEEKALCCILKATLLCQCSFKLGDINQMYCNFHLKKQIIKKFLKISFKITIKYKKNALQSIQTFIN